VRVNGRCSVSATPRPIDRFVAALTQKGCEPRRFGLGYTSRCPGPEHQPGDVHRALFVGEGADGDVVGHCFGDEDAETILRAAGVGETLQ